MGNTQNEKLKELTDRLEQGIVQIFDSAHYQTYLKVMSRFHNYSAQNIALITLKCRRQPTSRASTHGKAGSAEPSKRAHAASGSLRRSPISSARSGMP